MQTTTNSNSLHYEEKEMSKNLIVELQQFHHIEAAKRLQQLEKIQTLLLEMRQKEPVAYSPRLEALYQLSQQLIK
jgi:hypothetical protein